MSERFAERRQTPRIDVRGRASVQARSSSTVQLLDVSLGGVLLSSPERLRVGQVARLNVMLGQARIDTSIEVRFVRAGGDRYQIGARFVRLDPSTLQAMQQQLTAIPGTRRHPMDGAVAGVSARTRGRSGGQSASSRRKSSR